MKQAEPAWYFLEYIINIGSRSADSNKGCGSADINIGSRSADINIGCRSADINIGSKSADINIGSRSADINIGSTGAYININIRDAAQWTLEFIRHRATTLYGSTTLDGSIHYMSWALNNEVAYMTFRFCALNSVFA